MADSQSMQVLPYITISDSQIYKNNSGKSNFFPKFL